ncbi:MAG TPA: hypothetical protein VFP26_13885 [Gemmatimonadaceae bacterium]|jgi:hypothetical protein|nr:hypothetical protein [Gemmatimonadaceae bacterium]
MTRRSTRWLLATLALIACTDSTAPESRNAAPPTLSLPEYASQLRGDPFLGKVSEMLRHPELATAVDASLGAIDHPGQAQMMIVPHLAYDISTAADTTGSITESDVLQAVIEVTLDRIAQVASDSSTTDPPPTR